MLQKRKYFKVGIDSLFLYLGKKKFLFLNLIKTSPFEASIKITENCNSRCITCDVWKSGRQQDLKTEELENIFCELRDAKIKIIGFTGGEPLLRNDIGALIKKAKEITGGMVYIVTNGILLEEKAEEIINAGVDWVSVSLDGIGETDEKIRGVPGHFEKVINGVKSLKRLKSDLRINIGTTILKDNIKEIPQLINLCKELGAIWTFNLLDNNLYFFANVDDSNLRIRDDALVDKTINYLIRARKEFPDNFNIDDQSLKFARLYLKNQNPNFFCTTGYLRVYIDSKHNVYSGCWALPPIDNLKKNKLKNMIKSKEYKKRVQDMFYLKCPRCTCGYTENCMIGKLPQATKYIFLNMGFFKRFIGQ